MRAWSVTWMSWLPIVYKLLTNDRGKFFSLLIGITFAVFLMVQMTSIFEQHHDQHGFAGRFLHAIHLNATSGPAASSIAGSCG